MISTATSPWAQSHHTSPSPKDLPAKIPHRPQRAFFSPMWYQTGSLHLQPCLHGALRLSTRKPSVKTEEQKGKLRHGEGKAQRGSRGCSRSLPLPYLGWFCSSTRSNPRTTPGSSLLWGLWGWSEAPRAAGTALGAGMQLPHPIPNKPELVPGHGGREGGFGRARRQWQGAVGREGKALGTARAALRWRGVMGCHCHLGRATHSKHIAGQCGKGKTR